MALKIGIVGLPNVGKSTLFNALTRTNSAQSANYPFCTIDPNVGIVEVPDDRLDKLAKTSKSEKTLPTAIEFLDIAGLVKGASTGEGLGNKFLAHIRECNAIAHVVRIFDDPNITHVHGEINPKTDIEVIESELLLADLQTVEKRLGKAQSEAKSGDKDKKKYAELIEKLFDKISEGVLASKIDFDDEELEQIKDLHLLTIKPHLYIVNLPEDKVASTKREELLTILGVENIDSIIPVCAKIEQELAEFSQEEAKEFLEEIGLKETGLNGVIRSAYKILGLITYFTSGPKEARAWTVKDGAFAPQAAGVIHTDFEKGFIKAEVISWQNFVNSGGESGAKEKGLMHLEGKDYIVQDGDVMHFKFNN